LSKMNYDHVRAIRNAILVKPMVHYFALRRLVRCVSEFVIEV